jgi:hypothetical protein
MKYFSNILAELEENNEFSSFVNYKDLSPKMKDAVKMVYENLENDSNIVTNLENKIKEVSNEMNLNSKELYHYFNNEEIVNERF